MKANTFVCAITLSLQICLASHTVTLLADILALQQKWLCPALESLF